jgi:hypothetical protein
LRSMALTCSPMCGSTPMIANGSSHPPTCNVTAPRRLGDATAPLSRRALVRMAGQPLSPRASMRSLYRRSLTASPAKWETRLGRWGSPDWMRTTAHHPTRSFCLWVHDLVPHRAEAPSPTLIEPIDTAAAFRDPASGSLVPERGICADLRGTSVSRRQTLPPIGGARQVSERRGVRSA